MIAKAKTVIEEVKYWIETSKLYGNFDHRLSVLLLVFVTYIDIFLEKPLRSLNEHR